MRILTGMGIGVGLIFAIAIHSFSHIIPIGLLAVFLILSTPKGFCEPKRKVQNTPKFSGNWMRMGRGGC